MNGLPGRLTKKHIDLARAAGQDFIVYKNRIWTLKELEDGAGISRTKHEPETGEKLRKRRVDNSNGEVTELGSDSRKGTTSG